SSADKVMVMVEKSPLVTREWLYTAVTRAKILVLLVVVEEVDIGEAIARRTTRTTGMRIKPLGHC
ncbi:MAG: ATP-binding domain-containing protein, partial [Burkholderiaceae bacterium]|nr:ATP-binding domain-containing protein [Burkholderiaceae bacterium]